MMSFGGALTEHIKTEKFFQWNIENVDFITAKSLKNDQNSPHYPKYLESPIMTAMDAVTGITYNGKIRLIFETFPGNPTLSFKCTPSDASADGNFEVGCEYDGIEDTKLKENLFLVHIKNVKRLVIFVNLFTMRNQSFQHKQMEITETEKLIDRLKNMWKNDPSTHFTIKCGKRIIIVIKPILAASSPVFKKMFEIDVKETQENCMEIKEFDAKIVEKMIEFCENDFIEDIEECEEEIFKIAHKYQMNDLMNFSMAKMVESISTFNIESRIQLANLYDLKDFKKCCMQFAFRNNIEIEF